MNLCAVESELRSDERSLAEKSVPPENWPEFLDLIEQDRERERTGQAPRADAVQTTGRAAEAPALPPAPPDAGEG